MNGVYVQLLVRVDCTSLSISSVCRYTAWFRFDNRTQMPGNEFGRVVLNESLGAELYDHRGDTGMWLDWPGESRNLVNESSLTEVVRQLHEQLVEYVQLK